VRNQGRIAGLWYLVMVLVGPIRLLYIPSKLFVAGNATATVANIAAHTSLFRWGIAADLVGAIAIVMMALSFYRLFESYDKHLAEMVLIFGGIMPALLYIVGVASDIGTLQVVNGEAFLSVFDKPQRDALPMLLLNFRDDLNTAAEILWGVWLLPLAALIWRSRAVPRLFGIWLALGAAAYLVLCFTGVFAPEHTGAAFNYGRPFRIGETALMLWLVARGSNAPGALDAARSDIER
jgi:hypothetical protein